MRDWKEEFIRMKGLTTEYEEFVKKMESKGNNFWLDINLNHDAEISLVLTPDDIAFLTAWTRTLDFDGERDLVYACDSDGKEVHLTNIMCHKLFIDNEEKHVDNDYYDYSLRGFNAKCSYSEDDPGDVEGYLYENMCSYFKNKEFDEHIKKLYQKTSFYAESHRL